MARILARGQVKTNADKSYIGLTELAYQADNEVSLCPLGIVCDGMMGDVIIQVTLLRSALHNGQWPCSMNHFEGFGLNSCSISPGLAGR